MCWLSCSLAISSVVSPAAARMKPPGLLPQQLWGVARRGGTCWAVAGREAHRDSKGRFLPKCGKCHPHTHEANLRLLIICKLCKAGY